MFYNCLFVYIHSLVNDKVKEPDHSFSKTNVSREFIKTSHLLHKYGLSIEKQDVRINYTKLIESKYTAPTKQSDKEKDQQIEIMDLSSPNENENGMCLYVCICIKLRNTNY